MFRREIISFAIFLKEPQKFSRGLKIQKQQQRKRIIILCAHFLLVVFLYE
jgi:hypothetical protein